VPATGLLAPHTTICARTNRPREETPLVSLSVSVVFSVWFVLMV
jgi:hypothetical protein